MPGRRLTPDEAALWQRVRRGVRPLAPDRTTPPDVRDLIAADLPVPPSRPLPKGRVTASSAPPAKVPRSGTASASANTLDAGWDRRISRGALMPERTIDLHGHTLASAHAALDAGLGQAVAAGDRVVLLVTGRPPRPESMRPHARGAIRAAIGDWLAGSPYADRIAAVRGAHPRHGGAGALYVILRRRR